MSSEDGFSGGGFSRLPIPRVKSLSGARAWSQSEDVFRVRPGGSSFGVSEKPATHVAPTTGTYWQQQVAVPDKTMSTKYRSLFDSVSVTDVTRANKAFVKGSSDALSPASGVNTWRRKTYSDAGLMTTTLLRTNEASTAFGPEAMGSVTHDAGTGMMAEILARKWQMRNAGGELAMKAFLPELEKKYPQLQSVEKMRSAGAEALVDQIAQSRMNAAVSAGLRGQQKGVSDLSEYVQKKFKHHGLGPVPGGWARTVRELSASRTEEPSGKF